MQHVSVRSYECRAMTTEWLMDACLAKDCLDCDIGRSVFDWRAIVHNIKIFPLGSLHFQVIYDNLKQIV